MLLFKQEAYQLCHSKKYLLIPEWYEVISLEVIIKSVA